MEWSDDYKIGIPVIDSQHKRLFQLIFELNKALKAGLRRSDLEQLLSGLDQYITRHFQLEEKYMMESNYPKLNIQQKAHAYFTHRFRELSEEVSQGGMTPTIVQAIKGELAEWFKEHVAGLDVDFGKFYQVQDKNR